MSKTGLRDRIGVIESICDRIPTSLIVLPRFPFLCLKHYCRSFFRCWGTPPFDPLRISYISYFLDLLCRKRPIFLMKIDEANNERGFRNDDSEFLPTQRCNESENEQGLKTSSRLWGVLYSLDPAQGTIEMEDGVSRKQKQGPRRKAGYLIGRHAECDVVLNNPHISNRHCLIFKESCWHHELKCMQDLIFLEDFSSNGTYVNGTRVKRGVQHLLYHGDEIQLARNNGKSATEKFEGRFYFLHVPHGTSAGIHGKSKLDPKSTPVSKSIFDKYVLGEALGSGNFGTVRVATCRETKERYAVKVISKENFRHQPKFVVNLRQEITLLMSLSHPNIIEIHDVFDELGYVYLILEYMEGGELLDSIISEKFYPEHKAKIVMKQMFEALKYLHDRNISHRDLKPENILMFSKAPNDYRIKISDFGLAKFVDNKTFMGTLCGTPNYVAPEVLASDKDRRYTKSIDMWSAGIVMYICLCGFPPFSEDLSPPPMITQIRQGLIKFPSPHWDRVSSEATDLIKKLIVVDPSKRITAAACLKHPWIAEPDKSHDDSCKQAPTPISPLAPKSKAPIRKFGRIVSRPIKQGPNVMSPKSGRTSPKLKLSPQAKNNHKHNSSSAGIPTQNTPPLKVKRRSLGTRSLLGKQTPRTPILAPSWPKSRIQSDKRVSAPSVRLSAGLVDIRKAFLKEALKRYGMLSDDKQQNNSLLK